MSKRLMVIEDNVDLSRIYRDCFTEAGCEVLCVHDGREALQKIASFQPDVALCDIKMPHLTGFDFIKILNTHPELKSRTAIFILSAYGGRKMLEEARQLGIDSRRYFIKSQVALRQIRQVITDHFQNRPALTH